MCVSLELSAAVVVGVFWLHRDTSRFSQLDLMLQVSLGSCLQLSDSAFRCPCRVRLGVQPELRAARGGGRSHHWCKS